LPVAIFNDALPQQTLQQVSAAMSGIQTDMNPFKDSKGSLDAWAGVGGSFPDQWAPTPQQRPGVQFFTGDDHADKRALDKNVNPHSSPWLALAKTQLGTPYVWAASAPGSGFDCSGFAQWLVKRVTGVQLAHHAATQATETQRVGKDQLQPGDLLFLNYGSGNSHVEVYMGGGKMIGTANTTEDLDIDPVDWAHFQQGGRVPGMGGGSVGSLKGKHPKGTIGAAPAPSSDISLAPAMMTTPNYMGNNYFSAVLSPMLTQDPRIAPQQKDGSLKFKMSANASTSDIKAYARQQVLDHGWTIKDYNALVLLWNRESGWDPNATNSSSGATGIPQLNPNSHDIPANWNNPTVQIAWGLKYIQQRYGSPSAAWQHSQSTGWY
jgi:cell wall-associated NlpC family hydrolase